MRSEYYVKNDYVKNGTRWTIREGYERIQDSFGLDDLSTGLNGKDYKLIKENNVRSVISMPVSDINENGIYIKYFKRRGCFNYIKYLLVPTRTRTEWKVGNALLRENINTALPLAIAEKTTYKLQDTSLLVTEAITNSEMFHEISVRQIIQVLCQLRRWKKRRSYCVSLHCL